MDIPLCTGLVLSLVLHAVALTPFVRVLRAPAKVAAVSARFEPDQVDRRKPPPKDELVNLGIDESTRSSLTWVGYDEYRKHLARLSEIEQAAFTEAPTGVPTDAPTRPDEVVPGETQTVAAAEQPDDDAPEEDARADAEMPEPESAARSDAPERATDDPALTEAVLPLFRAFVDAASIGAATRQPEDAARADEKVRAHEPAPPAAASIAAREAPTRPPAPKPAAEAEIGAAADKESDPTSLIEVPLNMLGQPIAREGLELSPRRPRFPPLIRVTAVFGNPLVEIQFGRDGKPTAAAILQSSGDGRVDHAISVSLYRWRARGAALEKLAPAETLGVRLQIILNPRARR